MKQNSSTEKSKNSGFTLVELIVVIAILAILAAVAYPVYTGYIKKANEAADQILIGAVNEAFASACMDTGVDRMSLPIKSGAQLESTATADDLYTISGIRSVFGLKGEELENFQNAFDRYFQGNKDTKLEAISFEDIGFANGMFVTNIKEAVTEYAKSVFQNSNFNDNIEGLVGSVENVTSLFSQLAQDTNQPIASRLALLQILGVDVNTAVAALKDSYGLTDTSTGTEVANAMVLYVAHETNAMEDTSVLIDDLMSGTMGPDRHLVELPMMVGLAAAYYNSPYASQAYKDSYDQAMKTGGMAILNLNPQSDPDFGLYQENEMRADLEGYLAALTLVDQNKDSVDITREDAFSNDDFMGLINSILGS